MKSPVRQESSLLLRIAVFLLLLTGNRLTAQYPTGYQYTLLPGNIIDLILGASSGDMAMKHIYGLAPYSRPRNADEFPDNFRESSYILKSLKESGILHYKLEKVGKTSSWRAIEGSVWESSPGNSKIADLNDVPELLAEGSQSTEIRAKLIWVGEGQQSVFQANQNAIKEKIVVTSGSPYQVHGRALNAGAVGTISYYSSRALEDPLQVPNIGMRGKGFLFMLPPREGILLRDRLLRRENIEVEVKIKTEIKPVDLLVPQCVIMGKDTAAGEVILTAHIFEGYVKMGANDNMSGAAVILEVAKLLNKLIEEGRIPRPEHSIRFLWVPEFSGTIPWVNLHLEKVRNAVCNINLDMVGLMLRGSKSFFSLYRSGFSTAHYVNDVMESYYRYAGECNLEGLTDDLGRRGFSRRIVSLTGSDDPFYYRIMSLHGSSDNAVFNDWAINVPGIKMGTWPDMYYHSSEDNPDKCDPTQLRRAVFITAAGAYTLALGGESNALRILSEMYSQANTRMGIQLAKSGDLIWKSDEGNIMTNYKRALSNIEGFALAEKAAMEELRQVSQAASVSQYIRSLKENIDDLLQDHQSALKESMSARCRILGLQPVEIKLTELEKRAGSIIPHTSEIAEKMGYGGMRKYLASVDPGIISKHSYSGIVNLDEAAGLADGKRNLLQIKKMVDAQFEAESPLQDIINFYTVLKAAGLMEY